MKFLRIALTTSVLFTAFNSFAVEHFSFEGVSAADPNQACRIDYTVDGSSLKIEHVEGVGFKRNVLTEDENADISAEEREHSQILLSKNDLQVLGTPQIQQGWTGQKARHTEWDFGFRSTIYLGTSQDFTNPQSLTFDSSVRLFGVRSLTRYMLKCENLKRLNN